ncbi:MAG TPA: SLBB domain-containing protein [Gemmatimonadaceae bacterium]
MIRPLLAAARSALLAALLAAVPAGRAQQAQAQAPARAVEPRLARTDRVLVKLWVDSAFADTVRLGPDGMAILPRLGAVHLGGLPLDAVGDSVRRAYTRVLATPIVEVTPLIRVTAAGELRRPDVYYVEPGTAVRELVARAGGIDSEGRRDGVTLIRDGQQRTIPGWRIDDGSTVPLQSGDMIYVRRESWLRRNTLSVLSTATVVASLIITTVR